MKYRFSWGRSIQRLLFPVRRIQGPRPRRVRDRLRVESLETRLALAFSPTAVFSTISQPSGVRSTAVQSLDISFSTAVTGVDLGDVSLFRDGNPVSLASATLTGSGASYSLGNLGIATGKSGTYALKLNAWGSGIVDGSGTAMVAYTAVSWTASIPSPVATFNTIAMSSGSRTIPVNSLDIAFSTPVTGVDVGDFTLLRNGVPVSLANATLTGSGDRYTLGNLVGPTGTSGSYQLTLRGSGTGIVDAAGNLLNVPSSAAWTEAVTGPRVSFSGVSSSRDTAVQSIDVVFTTVVQGVDVGDFRLYRNGTSVSLAGATLTGAGDRYSLGNLAINSSTSTAPLNAVRLFVLKLNMRKQCPPVDQLQWIRTKLFCCSRLSRQ